MPPTFAADKTTTSGLLISKNLLTLEIFSRSNSDLSSVSKFSKTYNYVFIR